MRREPVKNPMFWTLWALIILISTPWYWPPKSYEPIVAGLPLWVLVTLIAILFYAIFVTITAYRFWGE